jgi:hypothetical protein
MGKRVTISTLLGVVAGLVCMALTKFAAGVELTPVIIAGGMFNRTFMGFVIGTTGIKTNPWLRGALLGLLVSTGWAIQLGPKTLLPFLIAGTIYGLVIDGLVSKALHADVA